MKSKTLEKTRKIFEFISYFNQFSDEGIKIDFAELKRPLTKEKVEKYKKEHPDELQFHKELEEKIGYTLGTYGENYESPAHDFENFVEDQTIIDFYHRLKKEPKNKKESFGAFKRIEKARLEIFRKNLSEADQDRYFRHFEKIIEVLENIEPAQVIQKSYAGKTDKAWFKILLNFANGYLYDNWKVQIQKLSTEYINVKHENRRYIREIISNKNHHYFKDKDKVKAVIEYAHDNGITELHQDFIKLTEKYHSNLFK